MICHRRKIIFIHIPKCAGSSVKNFYFGAKNLDWKTANYDVLYGYCPKRQIHLQHATARELVETGLISEENWRTYFKFTFVRNVFDRTYSDYLWIQKDRGITGEFEDYLNRTGVFRKTLTDKSCLSYRGDHLTPQTSFFDLNGYYKPDFIGRFESLQEGIGTINSRLNISGKLNFHEKKNQQKLKHYSLFFNEERKKMVEAVFSDDLRLLNYSFEQKQTGLETVRTACIRTVERLLSTF